MAIKLHCANTANDVSFCLHQAANYMKGNHGIQSSCCWVEITWQLQQSYWSWVLWSIVTIGFQQRWPQLPVYTWHIAIIAYKSYHEGLLNSSAQQLQPSQISVDMHCFVITPLQCHVPNPSLAGWGLIIWQVCCYPSQLCYTRNVCDWVAETGLW